MTALYQLTNGLTILRTSDGVYIPQDANNMDYRAYQAWVAQGNTPDAAPAPSAAKQASDAIATGVNITSTGTPSLNGVYAVDVATQASLNAIITYIGLNGSFPNSVPALPWPDKSGIFHAFPSVASFQTFATAIANFVTVVTIYGNSNGAIGAIPSNTITIP